MTRTNKLAMRLIAPAILLAASSITNIGCAPTGPERVAIRGTVTLDGQPVENAAIVFTPTGEGVAAIATISAGQFSLDSTSGPTIGTFDVRINPHDAELDAVEADPSILAGANRRPRIPKAYQRNGTLSATVTSEADQEFDFALSSKPK